MKNRYKILIVDSSSSDNTVSVARGEGLMVHEIERQQFNHGMTREMARKLLATRYVVMMTQDAYLLCENGVDLLLAPLMEGVASLSYGRQVAHATASPLEKFHRHWNYGGESHIRGKEDLNKHGKGLYFCSDAFAAYDNRALDSIGGFKRVLFGEDTLAAAELINKGYKIAYVAEAVVEHTHSHSLKAEFKRHFDIGFSRREQAAFLKAEETDLAKGRQYASHLLRYLWREEPKKLPYALFSLAARLIGYKLGQGGENLPKRAIKALSSFPGYWG